MTYGLKVVLLLYLREHKKSSYISSDQNIVANPRVPYDLAYNILTESLLQYDKLVNKVDIYSLLLVRVV